MSSSNSSLEEVLVREPSASSRVDGVILHALTINRDPRGTLTELLRIDWADVYGDDMPFAQTYVSTTAPGVARDEDRWHIHQHQTDRFYCLAGKIVVAVADIRSKSLTQSNLTLIEMEAGSDSPAPFLVTIPPGTLHGFVVTSSAPATLMNFPNRLYNPEDEERVPFPDAGITGPDGTPFSWDLVRGLT